MEKKLNLKNLNSQKLRRSLHVKEVLNINEGARTVEIAFSSEFEVERSFGIEILDHQSQSVRLGRLLNGGAVLVDHNYMDQVGVVVSARIDEDLVGRAVIRFGRSVRAQEIFQDVIDGIRQLISVGYEIFDYKELKRGKSTVVRITDWEPHELSIVSIPADTSVGIGRSQQENEIMPKEDIESTATDLVTEKTDNVDIEVERKKVQTMVRTQELKRIDQIREMAEVHDLDSFGAEAIRDGMSYEAFNKKALDKIGERNNAARGNSTHDGDVDLSVKDQKEFSMFRLMNALASPQDRAAQKRAAFEFEVTSAAAEGFGSDFSPRGAFVPDSVLNRDLNVGTPSAGGDLVGTSLLSGSFIEVFRNSMALVSAGAKIMPGMVGNVDIPRQTSGSVMAWINAEDGDATESEPSFDQISMTPKDAAVYTEITRRTLQQSSIGVESLIKNDLATAIALGLDLAGLYGAGGAGQPRGLSNTTGVNTVTFGAAAPTYLEVVRMIKRVLESNALMGAPRWLIESDGWEALSTTSKQTGGNEANFILGESERIKSYPYTMSNQITAQDYIFGDFSQMLIGEWGGLELNVDPYTHSLKGKVRYVVFKSTDIAIRHPESFCIGNDAI